MLEKVTKMTKMWRPRRRETGDGLGAEGRGGRES
jgi:hypothetical protein